jgi:hypothetical protein
MTAAVARSTASLSIPQTQNTAPVHEFRCLFTHDLRRKQKRWQDGLLKFHTFNKRVMVYDDVRNFIGDTHWKEGGALQTDDEITLDEGILVQLGDALRTIQTDLTPLFEREKKKGGEGQQKAPPGLSTAGRRTLGGQTNGHQVLQKKHRSLNALLGTPRGGHGRSVLPQSPYDARHGVDENERTSISNAKRRKVAEDQTSAQPRNVARMEKAEPTKTMPLWARTTDTRTAQVAQQVTPEARKNSVQGGQRRSIAMEIVDITSDNEVFPSDVTIPSTPAGAKSDSRPQPRDAPVRRNVAPNISPPPLSPPVSRKNRVNNIQNRLDEENARPNPPSPIHSEGLVRKPKALRLAKSRPRSMLLCQKPIIKKQGPIPATRRIAYEDPWNLSDLEEEKSPLEPTTSKKFDKIIPIAAVNRARALSKRDGLMSAAAKNIHESSSSGFTTMAPRAEHFKAPSPPFNPAVETSGSPPPKKKQRKQRSPSQTDGLAMMDQRLMSASSKAKSKPPARANIVAVDPSKPSTDRPFRRVQSEVNPSFPSMVDDNDADILFPINEEISPPAAPTTSNPKLHPQTKRTAQLKAPPVPTVKKRAQAKQPLQRAMSLNQLIEKTNPHSKQVEVERPFTAKREVEVGPWTVEATDLFDWRPPDWEERVKKKSAEKQM